MSSRGRGTRIGGTRPQEGGRLSSDGRKTECPECRYWNRSRRRAEVFSVLFDTITFNIEKTRQLIEKLGLAAEPIDVEQLRPFVQWPPPSPPTSEGGSRSMPIFSVWARINYDHVPHVDPSVPIILATFDIDGTGARQFPIDGHHRIARAFRDGSRVMLAYVLDERATRTVMRRRQPPTSPS